MYLSICFVYAGRESECLGQVLAGLQEAAQKPNQIKRIYSLTDEAGFRHRYKRNYAFDKPILNGLHSRAMSKNTLKLIAVVAFCLGVIFIPVLTLIVGGAMLGCAVIVTVWAH